MTSITVTINLDDLGEENEEGELVLTDTLQGTIQAQVVSAIVSRLVGKPGGYAGLESDITKQVEFEVGRTVRERLADLLTKPIVLTSRWNGAVEGQTSVEELTQKAVEKYLTTPSRSNRGYNDGNGNLGELIDDIVKGQVEGILKPTIDETKKRVSDQIIKQALAGAVAAITPKA